MKTTTLLFSLFLSLSVSAQSKGKIIPVDKTILKLSEDTTIKTENNKISLGPDYVITINKENNRRDTILVYRDLYIDRKRKPKN